MTAKTKAWRIWAVAPSEWMLRGIYIGRLWKAPLMTAECLDTPRHPPLDPNCSVGVYTFAHLEDALLEAVVLKTFRQQWMRHLNIDLTKIVLVLGVVELAGTINEWSEERLYAFERPGEFPAELRGQEASIQRLFLFESWLGESDRDCDRLVITLSRRYAPTHKVVDAMPDLKRLREFAVRPLAHGLNWVSNARAVAANVPADDVRHLSRVIREQLGPDS
jgi:hypothetical protein